MQVVRCFSPCLVLFLLNGLNAADSGPDSRLRDLIIADQESGRTAPDRWPDLSPEALHRREAVDRATLTKLHAINREQLANKNRTAWDLFEWSLDRRLAQFRLALYVTPFWDDERYLAGLPVLATAAQMDQASQKKLETYPAYLTQVVNLLRQGIARRMLPSAEFVRLYESSCSSADSGGRQRPSRSAAVQKAASEFCAFLANEYLPACPASRSLQAWPNGEEVYKELARRYTTTDLDPGQLHAFGLKEVERIREAMILVIARTGFKGGLDLFLENARSDKRFYFENSDDLLAGYRATMARIEPLVPAVIGLNPRKHVSLEAYDGQSAAVWQAGRPGHPDPVVLVAVNNPQIHPKFEMVPLLLHEGTPGHDLQHAVAAEVRVDNADPVAHFVSRVGQKAYAAFGEGWGLYAEGLGHEMGLYNDPYDAFGALRMELTRAVRVVIDTGIHSQGWSVSRAKEYFLAQTGKPAQEVDGEVARTLMPGGQLAYKVGQSRIESMRDEAKRALGSQFDLRRFNDAILQWGPVPLDILARRLNECLKATDCSSALKAVKEH